MQIAHEAFLKTGMRPGPVMTMSTSPVSEGHSADLSAYLYVCEICGVQLNKMMSARDGTDHWLHTRSWVRYDHDPIPKEVPRGTVKMSLCDFCGTEGQLQWAYQGDVVSQSTGNSSQNYGHIWSACKDCSPMIESGDIVKLADRVMRVSPMAHLHNRAEIRHSIMALHSQFIPTITSKTYMGPPVEPAEIKPRHLPKVREGLIRHWEHPGLYDRIANKPHMPMSVPGLHAGNEEQFSHSYYDGVAMPPEVFAKHARHIANGLRVDDTMYWISEDFTTLATMAGQDLTHFTLHRENLPSPFGLVVWARPIGEIIRPYGVASIRALSWTLVPGGIWLNPYILADDADPEMVDLPGHRAEWGHLQSPNVGSGLPWNWNDPITDDMRTSQASFLFTAMATWLLMGQPGVAAETPVPVDKAAARSYKRSGKKPPDVRIVDLRRHARPKTDTDERPGRRSPTVRFMVRGHWRNQAYGPKKGLRRQMYISPFIKGPEDAPLKSDVQTVKVLR